MQVFSNTRYYQILQFYQKVPVMVIFLITCKYYVRAQKHNIKVPGPIVRGKAAFEWLVCRTPEMDGMLSLAIKVIFCGVGLHSAVTYRSRKDRMS